MNPGSSGCSASHPYSAGPGPVPGPPGEIASVETRAVRRYDENIAKGIECTYEEIENDVRKRDYIDSHRDFAPLKCAADAVTLDTSFMTVEEVVLKVIEIINEKIAEKGKNE